MPYSRGTANPTAFANDYFTSWLPAFTERSGEPLNSLTLTRKHALPRLSAILNGNDDNEVTGVLRGKDVNDIIELRRQGLSQRDISSVTGFDPKTIRKYLKDPKAPQSAPRPKRPSLLQNRENL